MNITKCASPVLCVLQCMPLPALVNYSPRGGHVTLNIHFIIGHRVQALSSLKFQDSPFKTKKVSPAFYNKTTVNVRLRPGKKTCIRRQKLNGRHPPPLKILIICRSTAHISTCTLPMPSIMCDLLCESRTSAAKPEVQNILRSKKGPAMAISLVNVNMYKKFVKFPLWFLRYVLVMC